MKRSLVVLILALAALKLSPVSAFAAPPLETTQTQVDRALEVLRDPALKAESGKSTSSHADQSAQRTMKP